MERIESVARVEVLVPEFTCSIIIATYGDDSWEALAHSRALPSARSQPAHEVLIGHDPEGSVSSERNALAAEADGDWLCFLDGDDELAPGYLDAMQRALRQERRANGTPLLLTPAVSYVRKNLPGPTKFWPECSLETGNWLVIGTLVPRKLFLKVGGFRDFAHGLEDWNLWARCVRAGARIVKVRQAVYLAHWNSKSKHRELAQNRSDYMVEYEKARLDAWA